MSIFWVLLAEFLNVSVAEAKLRSLRRFDFHFVNGSAEVHASGGFFHCREDQLKFNLLRLLRLDLGFGEVTFHALLGSGESSAGHVELIELNWKVRKLFLAN